MIVSKEYIFVQTRTYAVEADSLQDAYDLVLGEDAEAYSVDMELEFKGEE